MVNNPKNESAECVNAYLPTADIQLM